MANAITAMALKRVFGGLFGGPQKSASKPVTGLKQVDKPMEIPKPVYGPRTQSTAAAAEADKLVRLHKQDHPVDVDDDGEELPQDNEQYWVDWPVFNLFIGLVIAANAVTIGLETSERSRTGGSSVIWFVIELAFCFIFLTELCCRLYYHRWKYFGRVGDAKSVGEAFEFSRLHIGNIFDFFIVIIAVIDTFILAPIGLGGEARFVAFLRFVRLVRLIRLIRLFRIFKELWLVASGLLDALRTLFWVCGLLGLFIEICAIVTTRAIGHNDEQYDPYFKISGGWDHEVYFKTVLRSMFTLFQIMTLDSWSDDIVRHIGKIQPGMVAFFIAFIAITNLGALNVIVGVVIEATMRTSQQDQMSFKKNKEKQRQMVFTQLKEIFQEADVDGSGTLNLDEVLDAVTTPDVYMQLKMIDFPADKPEEIFSLLDYDGSGELTIEEFITGCIRMKGPAKSKDLLVAQVAVNTLKSHFEEFEEEAAKFRKKIQLLDDTARALVGHGEHVFLNTREYRMRHPDFQELHVPAMPAEDMAQAPWMQPGGGGNAGLPAIADGDKHEALENSSPAHTLDVYQGNRNAAERPALGDRSPGGERSPGGGALALRSPPRPPQPPPPPMLGDRPGAAMLTNSPSPANEMALVQVPGAMPPEDPRLVQ